MELALEGKFSKLVVIKNGKLDCADLEDVVGNNKAIGAAASGTGDTNARLVTMDDDLVRTAKNIGISLGN